MNPVVMADRVAFERLMDLRGVATRLRQARQQLPRWRPYRSERNHGQIESYTTQEKNFMQLRIDKPCCTALVFSKTLSGI
jgi:hypothetical protein